MQIFKVLKSLKQRFSKQYPDSIDREHANQWFQEREKEFSEILKSIQGHFDSKLAFIDVGANIGFFTSQYLKLNPNAGSCFLFEPVPNLYSICLQNHKDHPQVKIFNFALSDVDASTDLYLAQDGNIGWNTLVATDQASNMKKIRIEAKRFQSIGINDKIGLIKIDVEGGEFKVLRGLMTAIQRDRPLIVCEVAWGPTHPNWSECLQVFRQLFDLGYQMYSTDWKRMTLEQISHTQDVFFSLEKLT